MVCASIEPTTLTRPPKLNLLPSSIELNPNSALKKNPKGPKSPLLGHYGLAATPTVKTQTFRTRQKRRLRRVSQTRQNPRCPHPRSPICRLRPFRNRGVRRCRLCRGTGIRDPRPGGGDAAVEVGVDEPCVSAGAAIVEEEDCES